MQAIVPPQRFRVGRRVLRALWVEQERSRVFVLAATAAYFCLMVIAHVRHESWRDEIHCWVVGHHARGLWDLLVGVRRYDGHPFLWYEVLHLVSRITPSVVGLHAITVALATAAAYLFLARAPFPRLIRLLALASYFLVFEYTVLCRGYVLGLFLLFAFTALYDRTSPRPIRLFVLLGLLAATSVYGTIIAVSLALFLCLQEARWWCGRDAAAPGSTPHRLRGFSLGLALFTAAVGVVVLTTLPPPDEFFAPSWHTQLGLPQVQDALLRWWIAIFPVPPPHQGGWELAPTGLWLQRPGFVHGVLPWAATLGLALCLGALATASWPAAVAYASVVVLMSLFQETRNLGDVRHWGHFLVALLACLWLAHQSAPRTRARAGLRLVTQVGMAWLLLLHDFAGAASLSADLAHPFSGSREAARFLDQAGLRDAVFVGAQDHLASAVTGTLDRPFWSANNGELGFAVVFHNRRRPATTAETFRLARGLLTAGNARPVVLIVSWSIPPGAVPADLRMEVLHETGRALHPEETYHLYRVRRAPPGELPGRGEAAPPPAP